MEDLNIFKNPETKEKLNIESALLIYRLRFMAHNQHQDMILSDTTEQERNLMFGVGKKSYIMTEAMAEFFRIGRKFNGIKLGDLL